MSSKGRGRGRNISWKLTSVVFNVELFRKKHDDGPLKSCMRRIQALGTDNIYIVIYVTSAIRWAFQDATVLPGL